MDSLETTLEVNKFAQKARHLKIFSKGSLVKVHLGQLASLAFAPMRRLMQISTVARSLKFLSNVGLMAGELLPIAPQKRLLTQSSIIAISALIITSVFPGAATFIPAQMTYATDYIAAYSIPGDILVSDEDGYLVKINPQTNESNRIGLTDYAVHTVDSGESLSQIAADYGVKVETIMWENGIANANSLRIGQTLLVPPVDGVGYKVSAGDSLEKIAKKFNLSTESIIAQNNLESEVIHKGQNLFLPGAVPIAPPINIATNYRSPVVTRDDRALSDASSSTATPAVGKIFIFPTIGKVTQGYRGGHYALDIADRSKPPIWAAAGGTVVKASSGTWGGGYGNHVIIDHGNGIKTLYGHMSSLNVYEGQWVNQGDVIGIMGNTGRVYGVTGIHLHWEVIVDGVKQNPYNYF